MRQRGCSARDARRRLNVCGRLARITLATMFSQISQQRVHLRKVGPINQVSTTSLTAGHSRVREFFQMKRERTRGHAQELDHRARCQAALTRYNKRAKYSQTLLLRNRGQRPYGDGFSKVGEIGLFHDSTMIE